MLTHALLADLLSDIYGRFPFDQKIRFEYFPEISSAKWYSIFWLTAPE